MRLGLENFQADEVNNIITAVNPKDHTTYVYVPAGEFLMGSPLTEPDAGTREHPLHLLYLDEFWISQTEVTRQQYSAYRPEDADLRGPSRFAPQYPMTEYVAEATWYAEWAGGRLPTEAEWEKACRGADGRRYPWGNDPPTAKLANYADKVRAPVQVKSYPGNVSPYGAYDMAGNAVEWVYRINTYYPYRDDGSAQHPEAITQSARGGLWSSSAAEIRCAQRFELSNILSGIALMVLMPDYQPKAGFRVVLVTPEESP